MTETVSVPLQVDGVSKHFGQRQGSVRIFGVLAMSALGGSMFPRFFARRWEYT